MQRQVLLAITLIVTIAGLSGCGSGTAPGGGTAVGKPPVTLLNVSYDPTREFYQEFNAAFAEHWKQEAGQTVVIEQSHGGSGKQARAVIDGLEADVVTLALAYDVAAIARRGAQIAADWQQRLPHNSAPYTSTIVFLVRQGNPKQIRDWDDLVKGDVAVITPNPKTSGGALWNYLAAWGFVLKRELGSFDVLSDPAQAEKVAAAEAKAREFVTQLYRRVPVLDSGARGATNTFVQRGIGDVLLAWENEAFLAVKGLAPGKFEIVVPSLSIRAEPPVAWVDKVVEKHGTREVAEAYLKYLYTPRGQELAAKHFYRPAVPDGVPEPLLQQFAQVELFTIDAVFGGWDQARAVHFDDGQVFDQIYRPGK